MRFLASLLVLLLPSLLAADGAEPVKFKIDNPAAQATAVKVIALDATVGEME